MKLRFCLFVLIMCSMRALPQQLDLIPYPNEVISKPGFVAIKRNAAISTANKQFSGLLTFINTRLKQASPAGKLVGITPISLQLDKAIANEQGYTLNTTGKIITVKASNEQGLFNGLATLYQLIISAKGDARTLQLPKLVINDAPRYAWRGFMLDESRHFFGQAEVEKLLDWMAFYKLNRFHWHLTDAHGWRIEIKKYPKLTTIGARGSFSDPQGPPQFYTQKQIKQIVAYAAARNITIIPEIDMPGHATAANKAYPQYSGGSVKDYENFTFDPSKTDTYTFLTDVLKELNTLFKSNMVHIGGDEVALGIKAWESNAGIQAFMKKQALTSTHQLEQYFIRRMADSAAKIGNRVFCWDEVTPAGLSTGNTVINWWRHNKPEMLDSLMAKGYHTILCPRLPMYFDFVQDSTHMSGRKWGKLYNSLSDVYGFPENTVKPGILASPNVIGMQANLWTESVISAKRMNYLIFPRIAAMAEAGWTKPAVKNESLFNIRLKTHLDLYQKAAIYYYDPFQPKLHKEAIDVQISGQIAD